MRVISDSACTQEYSNPEVSSEVTGEAMTHENHEEPQWTILSMKRKKENLMMKFANIENDSNNPAESKRENVHVEKSLTMVIN